MTLTPMVLPKSRAMPASRNYGRFIISPLESGYGITVGNALRRVLLSSLPGAAVTSMRVSDVPHEFSAIPNIKEDMTQLILQVKQLRLKWQGTKQPGCVSKCAVKELLPQATSCAVRSDRLSTRICTCSRQTTTTRSLRSSSPCRPDAATAPLTSGIACPSANCPLMPSTARSAASTSMSIGARVGQRTNYDKLILEIWTDGTIRAEEAMSEAAQDPDRAAGDRRGRQTETVSSRIGTRYAANPTMAQLQR